jgi:hypothetical protein
VFVGGRPKKKIEHMLRRRPHFTHLALGATAAALLFDGAAALAPLALCWLWGVAAAFFVVPVVDPTAYRRMARKNDWTMAQFHAGNLLLHAAPPLLATPALLRRATPTAAHGLAAAGLHLLWGRWASVGRGLRLDVVYVPLRDWTVPWACAVAAEVGVAAVAQAVATAGGGGRS